MIFFSIPIKEHPSKADSGDKINFLPRFNFYNQLQLYQWWHYWINGGYWISDHNQIWSYLFMIGQSDKYIFRK
jgi:hypothetical protein